MTELRQELPGEPTQQEKDIAEINNPLKTYFGKLPLYPAFGCENDPKVVKTKLAYEKSVGVYDCTLGKLDLARGQMSEGLGLRADVQTAHQALGLSDYDVFTANVRVKDAEIAVLANDTPETQAELLAAQGAFVIAGNTALEKRKDFDDAVAAFDSMVPNFDKRVENVKKFTDNELKHYAWTFNAYSRYLKEEALCRTADSGGPRIQKIQLRRGETRPQDGVLSHGELAFSTTQAVDADGKVINEIHLWIGDSDQRSRMIFAQGGVDTEFSQEKIIDDVNARITAEMAGVDASIADLLSNLDTEALDSMTELAAAVGELKLTDGGILRSLSDAIAASRVEHARMRSEHDMDVSKLREQHNFEIESMQRNFETIDGGGWDDGK